jgi:hypothetical protein
VLVVNGTPVRVFSDATGRQFVMVYSDGVGGAGGDAGGAGGVGGAGSSLPQQEGAGTGTGAGAVVGGAAMSEADARREETRRRVRGFGPGGAPS